MRLKRMQQGGDVNALLRELERQRTPQRPAPAPAASTRVSVPAFRTPEQAAMDESLAGMKTFFGEQRQEFDPAAGQGVQPFYMADIFGPSGDVKEVTRAAQEGDYGTAATMAALAFTPIPAKTVRFLRESVPMVFRNADFAEIADDVLMDIGEVPNAPRGSEMNAPFDLEDHFFSQSQAAERVAQMDKADQMAFFEEFEDLAIGLDYDDPKLADQLRKASEALQESTGKIMADMEGVKLPDKVFRTGGDRPLEFKLDSDVNMGRMEYTGYDLTHEGVKYDTVAEYERAVGRPPEAAASADIVSNKNRMDLDGNRSYADYAFNIKVPADAPATTALRLMRKLLNSVPDGKIIEAGGSLSADSYPFVMSGLKRGKAELAKSIRVPSGVSYKPLNAMGENYTALPKMLNIPKKDAMQLFETTKVNVYEGISVPPEVLKKQLWEKHKGSINAALKEYGLPPAKWEYNDVQMPHPYLRKLEDYRRGGYLGVKKKKKNTFGLKR